MFSSSSQNEVLTKWKLSWTIIWKYPHWRNQHRARQFQGNAIQQIDKSMCTRFSYLTQNFFDMKTSENLVTVTGNDVYMCEHTQRSKQSYDSTYCGSWGNRLIVSQHTDVVLLALRWVPQLGTSLTAFIPSFKLHWLDLQKEQNSPLKWSRAVKNSCAHHYVLNGSTLPMWKPSDDSLP